jgi:hypothetical protein
MEFDAYRHQDIVLGSHVHNRAGLWSMELTPPRCWRGSGHDACPICKLRSKPLVDTFRVTAVSGDNIVQEVGASQGQQETNSREPENSMVASNEVNVAEKACKWPQSSRNAATKQ